MAAPDAVALVTESLEKLLNGALVSNNLGEALRHMLQPPPAPNRPMLTIFLYDVAEDSTVRNRAPVTRWIDVPDVNGQIAQRELVTRAPIPLVLRYMLTPWTASPADAQKMLGHTISVLHDARTLLGTQMRELLGAPETSEPIVDLVSIQMAQLTLEEKAKVWWAIQQPFHLSVMYEIRVVDIDVATSGVLGGDRVTQRRFDGSVPLVPA